MTNDDNMAGKRDDLLPDREVSPRPIADTNTEPLLAADAANAPVDPNDEIPVPVAMWPAEIDERAQVVEALRGNGPPPRTDTQVDPTADVRADQA
jgi:hypothetical protein